MLKGVDPVGQVSKAGQRTLDHPDQGNLAFFHAGQPLGHGAKLFPKIMDLIKTHDPYPPDTLTPQPGEPQRPQSRPDPGLLPQCA